MSYRERTKKIEDLCNVVVHEEDDVEFDRGEGVLKDPNHEYEHIAGYKGNQANNKDYWMPLIFFSNELVCSSGISSFHFVSKT